MVIFFGFFSVDRWAKKLGDELWDLAETITQREEIRSVGIVVANEAGC